MSQVCLGKEGQQGPRLSCTREGEVVCQAGWQVGSTGHRITRAHLQGAGCHAPVCADGCHSGQGYCRSSITTLHINTSPITTTSTSITISTTIPTRKPGECLCKSGYSGPGCGACVRLLGCVHGSCDKPFQCLCKEGWR